MSNPTECFTVTTLSEKKMLLLYQFILLRVILICVLPQENSMKQSTIEIINCLKLFKSNVFFAVKFYFQELLMKYQIICPIIFNHSLRLTISSVKMSR